MILYCVRHGESSFNAEGRVQGQLDVPLSEHGRRQSEAVARALAVEPVDAVYTSPLRRARETAEMVGAKLGLPVQADPRLVEIHAGVFQGLRWPEITERYPEAAARWKAGDPDFVVPEGESRRSLMTRGHAAFEAIRAGDQHRVLVVAHGGLIAAAFKALLGIPAERHPFRFYNGAISRLEWSSHIKLITLNEVDHLRDLEGGVGRTGDL